MHFASRIPSSAAVALAVALAWPSCKSQQGGGTAPRSSAAEAPSGAANDVASVQKQADGWRKQHRLIDMHEHIAPVPEALTFTVRLHDAVGIGLAVNLSGGTVTPIDGGPSAFERTKGATDQLFPGRFVEYMNLDYERWDDPDFAQQAVKQVERGFALGAAGFKEYKRLGLGVRDKDGKLVRVDDPKLDGVWRRCGELGMPISIHTSDPKAFWDPLDPKNERWDELQDHPRWWFGDSKVYPPRMELLQELDNVIGRHPETTFVSVHFGNNAEDLAWVDAEMDRHPNMWIDLAARVPEIGRHPPEEVHRFFMKHQDKILFATDMGVSDEVVLGSSGDGPPPTFADGVDFFQKHWRWMETWDKNFPHMTPIQGRWTISGIGLPAGVLRKVYFDNARRLLARSLPPQMRGN